MQDELPPSVAQRYGTCHQVKARMSFGPRRNTPLDQQKVPWCAAHLPYKPHMVLEQGGPWLTIVVANNNEVGGAKAALDGTHPAYRATGCGMRGWRGISGTM